MHHALAEQDVTCPYCWQTITLLVDLSAGDQEYIEDCSVCCRPMRVVIQIDGDKLRGLFVHTDQ